MAEINPIGIDQTTGQQRSVATGDTVNVGNTIDLCVTNPGDYTAGLSNTRAVFPTWESGTTLTTPASVPVINGNTVRFSPNNEYLAYGNGGIEPRMHIYRRTGTSFNLIVGEPASIADNSFTTNFDWTQNGEFLAAGQGQGGAGFAVYQRDGDSFTLLANPTTTPDSINANSSGTGVAWTPNGEYLAVTHTFSPHLLWYRRDGTTLTTLTSPASVPASISAATGNMVAWSPDGRFLAAVSTITAPGLYVYERSGDTLTLNQPASIPDDAFSVRFSPDGKYLTVGRQSAPRLLNYSISGSTFTLLPEPASIPTGTVRDIVWSCNSRYVFMTGDINRVYQVEDDTFTVIDTFNNSGNENGIDISSDIQFLAMAHSTSPYLTIHQTGATMPTSGIVVMQGVKRAGT